MSGSVLSVRDLTVRAHVDSGPRTLLDAVSLDLGKGEILGLVGESGSGKSLFCRSLVRLLPSSLLKIESGSVLLEGRDLMRIDDGEMLKVRGGEIGMIFQNPTSHLDPVMRIGDQIAEGIRYHQGLGAREARAAATEILAQVGFPDPKRQYDSYPHEFSGGMRQRAMIGVALSCNPKILIADEPTTALDVTIQAQILRLLIDIRDRRGLSIILITHDLGIVAQTCDRIAVLRGGKLLEEGPKRTILARPQHPYTINLINSHPSLPSEISAPLLENAEASKPARPLLEIDDLHVRFRAGGALLRAVPRRSAPLLASACRSCRARRSASSANPAAARARLPAPCSASHRFPRVTSPSTASIWRCRKALAWQSSGARRRWCSRTHTMRSIRG